LGRKQILTVKINHHCIIGFMGGINCNNAGIKRGRNAVTIGAAATAARILGLDAEGTTRALSIAASEASGLKENCWLV